MVPGLGKKGKASALRQVPPKAKACVCTEQSAGEDRTCPGKERVLEVCPGLLGVGVVCGPSELTAYAITGKPGRSKTYKLITSHHRNLQREISEFLMQNTSLQGRKNNKTITSKPLSHRGRRTQKWAP